MIKVKMGREEMRRLTLRQLLAAQTGEMEAMLSILSHFVYDDGVLLDPVKGRDVLLDLTLEELEEVMGTLKNAITDGAVPPMNATSSNSQ